MPFLCRKHCFQWESQPGRALLFDLASSRHLIGVSFLCQIIALESLAGAGFIILTVFSSQKWVSVKTPFGKTSDQFPDRQVGRARGGVLPRHGRGHRLLPSELNHRANIWAMKKLGVAWIISVSAVGSLQAQVPAVRHCVGRSIPGPDQEIARAHFFGRGIVAHVAFADPVCEGCGNYCSKARALKARVHDGGTYVNMEGPAFSTAPSPGPTAKPTMTSLA